MRNKRIRFAPVRSEPVIMDGGLNENVNNIELKGGELISCLNYELVDGSQGGYRSISGYERFDGQPKPSATYASEADHAAQDAARALIDEVPGSGPVLGVWIFEGKVYAFRDTAAPAAGAMYVESAAGWDEIDTALTPITAGGSYNFINYSFTGDPADNSMYWTNGKNQCMAFNGTTITKIDTGMGALDTPINVIAHGDRLWLAFESGSLQYSTAGDPADWSTNAGEFGLGQEITNLVTTVANTLVVFCKSTIKIINGYSSDDFVLDTYSSASGAFKDTACRLFGSIIFMDDRGVTGLEAAQEYGDFKANSISQKVHKTLLRYKTLITCAMVHREKNQYRLFFSDGHALYFSFFNKKLRGVTLIKFANPVLSVCEGEDTSGNSVIFFASSDGYVYQMDSGTSFDGSEILTTLKTAFYHYRSPRLWKRFKEIVFEIFSTSDITIDLKFYFDYGSNYVPSSSIEEADVIGAGDQWGVGEWGTMTYTGSGVTNRIKYLMHGIGSNMSVSMRTSNTYLGNHTIQNITTDYQLSGRQL